MDGGGATATAPMAPARVSRTVPIAAACANSGGSDGGGRCPRARARVGTGGMAAATYGAHGARTRVGHGTNGGSGGYGGGGRRHRRTTRATQRDMAHGMATTTAHGMATTAATAWRRRRTIAAAVTLHTSQETYRAGRDRGGDLGIRDPSDGGGAVAHRLKCGGGVGIGDDGERSAEVTTTAWRGARRCPRLMALREMKKTRVKSAKCGSVEKGIQRPAIYTPYLYSRLGDRTGTK